VFDRVRENLAKFRKRETEDLLDLSINETLSRTLLTSATTLFVVTMLLLFGGEIIHDFAFALFVGILVGTYSSIYVASPIFLLLQEKAPPKPATPSNTELTQESQ
jgi:preprotein translocase subunit SecF